MKAFFLLASFALTATATPLENARMHGKNGWYIPQQNGSWLWMDMAEAKNELAEIREKAREWSSTSVDFYLYTKKNALISQQITATKASIDDSNFNSANPTRFIVHGFLNGHFSLVNREIRDAWLSQGDYNIIVVDWVEARIGYITAVNAVPDVGENVADMIDFLVTKCKMSLDTLIVIGHSLGAHVVGFAGKNVQSGKIHTIFGLDPALPLFSYDEPDERLSSTDANFVQIIHTNGGGYGFREPIGEVDFYVNGGESQPGCEWEVVGFCSHVRSFIYYAEAVELNDFKAISCDDYEEAIDKACGRKYSSVRMGTVNKDSLANGVFYVPVNSAPPYGRAGRVI